MEFRLAKASVLGLIVTSWLLAVLTEAGQTLGQSGDPRVGSRSVCLCVKAAIDDSCL